MKDIISKTNPHFANKTKPHVLLSYPPTYTLASLAPSNASRADDTQIFKTVNTGLILHFITNFYCLVFLKDCCTVHHHKIHRVCKTLPACIKCLWTCLVPSRWNFLMRKTYEKRLFTWCAPLSFSRTIFTSHVSLWLRKSITNAVRY